MVKDVDRKIWLNRLLAGIILCLSVLILTGCNAPAEIYNPIPVPEAEAGFEKAARDAMGKGRFRTAASYYEMALEEASERAASGNLYYEMGRAYFELGYYGRAAKALERAVELWEEGDGNLRELCLGYYYLGHSQLESGNAKKAVKMQEKALTCAEQMTDSRDYWTALVYDGLASAYAKQKKTETAMDYYGTASGMAPEGEEGARLKALIYQNQAKTYYEGGDTASASASVDQCVDTLITEFGEESLEAADAWAYYFHIEFRDVNRQLYEMQGQENAKNKTLLARKLIPDIIRKGRKAVEIYERQERNQLSRNQKYYLMNCYWMLRSLYDDMYVAPTDDYEDWSVYYDEKYQFENDMTSDQSKEAGDRMLERRSLYLPIEWQGGAGKPISEI